MDNNDNEIKKQLAAFAGKQGASVVFPAKVLSINGDDTIEVELGSGLVIDDCRLKSVIKEGNKIVLQPSIGSTVQIASIENSSEFIVVAVEAIERMYVKIGSLQFEMTDKFAIKKDADSLKNILGEFIDEVNKIVVMIGTSPNVAALTAIKNRVNQMFS